MVKSTATLAAAAEKAGLTMAAGQRERAAMYARCKNKLEAVTYLALDFDLVANINSFFGVSRPISHYLNAIRRDVRGRSGTWEYWRTQAQGHWKVMLTDISSACIDPDIHRTAGLVDEKDATQSVFYQAVPTDDGLLQHQDFLYERLVRYSVGLMRFVCLYERPDRHSTALLCEILSPAVHHYLRNPATSQ